MDLNVKNKFIKCCLLVCLLEIHANSELHVIYCIETFLSEDPIFQISLCRPHEFMKNIYVFPHPPIHTYVNQCCIS